MTDYLDWLGHEVTDRVTGFAGVVDSVSFDLYGCVSALITPKHSSKDKEKASSIWFDIKRLKRLSKKPVMEQPSFGKPGTEIGPAHKPAR